MKVLLQRLTPWIRVAIGAALLWFLFRKTDAASLLSACRQVSSNWPWMAAAIAATFLGLMAGAIRWKRILAVLDIHVTTAETLRIYFIGQFFNSFLLGACGGDVVRAYYVTRGREGRRAEAATTIAVDRAIGLFCTILFACVMIAIRIQVFLDNEGPRDTGFLMLLFLAGTISAMFVLFRKNVFEHFRFFQRLENNTRLGPVIRRTYEVFYMCRSHHRMLLAAAFLSILSLAFQVLACWCFGRALELDSVRIPDYFALFPVITVLMAIPLTPGALGVRESLFVSLFRSVMVDRPHAILLSLLVYAGGLFWSLFGGLVFLGFGGRGGHSTPGRVSPWNQAADSN